jgi:hypothetical protein
MFPPDNIPNSLKDKAWLLKWGSAINSYHVQSWNMSNFPRSLHSELVSYRNGVQDQNRYKRTVNKLANNNQKTVPGTSWRNLKIMEGYLKAVNGKLNRMELEPRVKQIDAFANEYRELFDANIRAAMTLRENQLEYQQILEKVQMTTDELPLTDDERQLILMFNPRIREEMELEVAIGGVLETNKMDIIRKQVRLDWLTLGIGGYRIDNINGRRKIRRLDPLCSGTSICTTEDFSDIRFAYEIIARTPDEIRMMAQGQITEEDYQKILNVAGTTNPVATINGGFYPIQGQQPYNVTGQKYANIVDFEIISVCDLDVDMKLTGNGFLAVDIPLNGRNPTVERPDRQVVKSKIQRIYTGKYVIGTNVIFDAGEKYQEVRPPVPGQMAEKDTPLGKIEYTDEMYEKDLLLTDPARSLMGFKWYQPGLAYGASISLAQAMLPHIDNLQITWNNITNSLSTWVGRGISIDLDSIVNLELGGKKIGEAELISLLLEKNISLYRSSAMSKLHNARAGQGALDFKDDPIDVKTQSLVNLFTQQLNILRQISGLNSLDVAGAPNSEIGLGVSELAAEGTDNMIEDIRFADIKTFESVCQHLLYDIQQYGASGSHKGKPFILDPALHSSNIYNLTIEALPSEREKAILYEKVSRYAEQTQDENLLIEVQSCATLSQARLLFAAKQKRAKVEARAEAKANVDYATEQQQASAAAKAKSDSQLQAQKDASKKMEIETQGRVDLVNDIVIEGMKMGKTPEDIAKLVALASLATPVVPLEQEATPTEQLQIA